MSSILRKVQRDLEEAQIAQLEWKERKVAELIDRRMRKAKAEEGRLFRGHAPNKDCIRRRQELFQRWTKLCQKYNPNPRRVPEFCAFLREQLRKHPDERHPTLDFMREVDEHNRIEAAIEQN